GVWVAPACAVPHPTPPLPTIRAPFCPILVRRLFRLGAVRSAPLGDVCADRPSRGGLRARAVEHLEGLGGARLGPGRHGRRPARYRDRHASIAARRTARAVPAPLGWRATGGRNANAGRSGIRTV